MRPTVTIAEIAEIVRVVKAVDSSIIVTVDNCYGMRRCMVCQHLEPVALPQYVDRERPKWSSLLHTGEFTEAREPGHAGADVVMGSFIKNPGGTIAHGESSSCRIYNSCNGHRTGH
jgi:cystathionine beta-lyase family protein involved in aluminum resistance